MRRCWKAAPDIVTRLTGNLLEAAVWARDFPKEALRQARRRRPGRTRRCRAAYGSLIVEGVKLGLEDDRLAALDQLENWLQGHNLLPRDHDIAAWLSPEVLATARSRLKEVA